MASWRAWVVGATLAVSGCSEWELPPVVAETEHFRYRTRSVHPPCPAALQWLELQYAVLSDWFDASLPPGRKFDYTHVRSFLEMDEFCGANAGGCAGDGMAFAFDAYNAHEVVHLLADLVGDPPALFREGIAEVLGCNPMAGPVEVDASMALWELLDDGAFRAAEDAHQAYRWAAGFTRFLLDRHGREAFLGFYAQVPRGASIGAIQETFSAHFGEDLRTAMETWREAAPQTYRHVCMHLAECAAPPLPSDADETLPFTCGIGHGMAPRALVRTLELPEAAGVRLAVEGEAPTRMEVFPCDPGARAVEHARRPEGHSELWTTLPAGRYWVRIADTEPGPHTTEPIPLRIEATAVRSLLTPALDDAAVQWLAAEGQRVVVRDWFDDAPDTDAGHQMALAFAADGASRLSARTFAVPNTEEDDGEVSWFDGRAIHLCEGTSDPAACHAVELGETFREVGRDLSAETEHRVVIHGAPSSHGVMVELLWQPQTYR